MNIKSTMFSPQEIKLAQELAKALDDQKSISFYLSCTKKYSHRKLREKLQQALEAKNVWKSRAAIFTDLIMKSRYEVSDDENLDDPEYENTRN